MQGTQHRREAIGIFVRLSPRVGGHREIGLEPQDVASCVGGRN